MLDKALTLLSLGFGNLVRVGTYRIGLRLGLHPVLWLQAQSPTGPFYENNAPRRHHAIATRLWTNSATFFSAHHFPLTGPPNWHANPFRPGVQTDQVRHWSRIADFDQSVGDIKAVWEASRFDWLIAMAQRASLGDNAELARLNTWLVDWSGANSPISEQTGSVAKRLLSA